MSRKLILSLAAIATLATAAITSGQLSPMAVADIRWPQRRSQWRSQWRPSHWLQSLAPQLPLPLRARPALCASRRLRGAFGRAGPLHLPDQELHAGRHGGVPGSVHQGNGECAGRRQSGSGSGRTGVKQLRRPHVSGLPEGQSAGRRAEEKLRPRSLHQQTAAAAHVCRRPFASRADLQFGDQRAQCGDGGRRNAFAGARIVRRNVLDRHGEARGVGIDRDGVSISGDAWDQPRSRAGCGQARCRRGSAPRRR